MIKKIFIVCLTLCFVPLSACGKTEKIITIERTSEVPVKLNENGKDNTTKLSGVVQRDKELYFANSLEDFIDCYNDYYTSLQLLQIIALLPDKVFQGFHKGR